MQWLGVTLYATYSKSVVRKLVCHGCCSCVVLPQVCGKGPATTHDKLEAALFDGLTNSQPQTVQGAFKSCSYGSADFSKSESGVQVLSVTVPVPCQGTTPWNMQYDSSTCPYVGECMGVVLRAGRVQTDRHRRGMGTMVTAVAATAGGSSSVSRLVQHNGTLMHLLTCLDSTQPLVCVLFCVNCCLHRVV
jgi:hypothetical protein